MTALDLLKDQLRNQYGITHRTVTDEEVRDLSPDLLAQDTGINMIQFPLPVPEWTSATDAPEVKSVLPAHAWEWSGSLFFLVNLASLPDDTVHLIHYLNARQDTIGRFYVGQGSDIFYQMSQVVFCKDETPAKLRSLVVERASRESAEHIIVLALAGILRDISFCQHAQAQEFPLVGIAERIGDSLRGIEDTLGNSFRAIENVIVSLGEFIPPGDLDPAQAASMAASEAEKEIRRLRRELKKATGSAELCHPPLSRN